MTSRFGDNYLSVQIFDSTGETKICRLNRYLSRVTNGRVVAKTLINTSNEEVFVRVMNVGTRDLVLRKNVHLS